MTSRALDLSHGWTMARSTARCKRLWNVVARCDFDSKEIRKPGFSYVFSDDESSEEVDEDAATKAATVSPLA